MRVALRNRRTDAGGSDTEREIIAFCAEPRSREGPARRFSNVSITYLMAHWMKPLIEEGRIRLIMPDKPKSKYQRYHA